MSRLKEIRGGIQGTSRREFLRRVAKGGSVAALISGGLLDAEISKLIAAWAPQQSLSREAIEGPLPTKNLVVLRDLLKGEYYLGGRFYRLRKGDFGYIWGRAGCDPEMVEGKCPEVGACARYCNGEINCPSDSSGEGCGGQGCPDYKCDEQTCTDGHGCKDNSCWQALCGNEAAGCTGEYFIWGIAVDSRALPGFSFQDITKYADTAFVQELSRALNIRSGAIRSAASVEKEVRSMIFKRQTLKMRGITY
jgi:hypothetical protein